MAAADSAMSSAFVVVCIAAPLVYAAIVGWRGRNRPTTDDDLPPATDDPTWYGPEFLDRTDDLADVEAEMNLIFLAETLPDVDDAMDDIYREETSQW